MKMPKSIEFCISHSHAEGNSGHYVVRGEIYITAIFAVKSKVKTYFLQTCYRNTLQCMNIAQKTG